MASKENKNIILLGFMGSGKSCTSQKLGDLLKREVVSTDKLIEQKEGKTIADIFKEKGEAYFRQLEREIVSTISSQRNRIVDCGGGVVADPVNIEALRKNGTLIYLSASPEFLYKNIQRTKKRPLLNVENPLAKIRELLAQREKFYQKADIILDTNNKTIDEIAGDVLRALKL